ncbi:hypothetical protein T4A_2632 [Trichinella pseudospiralis]|uniref:Uncharacterized protein n=1 Tax=Trichinella pseudospiralis TaxID=6337 RepID=A0A0V1DS96_TRIPS|nr:hypothetical protein T4A_2632 [Trichinella pseudospiralis]
MKSTEFLAVGKVRHRQIVMQKDADWNNNNQVKGLTVLRKNADCRIPHLRHFCLLPGL